MTFGFQESFNVAIMLIGFLGGFILTSFRSKIDALSQRDLLIADEVHKVHLLVAGEYLKKSELVMALDPIHNSLRRIEDALGTKADKQ